MAPIRYCTRLLFARTCIKDRDTRFFPALLSIGYGLWYGANLQYVGVLVFLCSSFCHAKIVSFDPVRKSKFLYVNIISTEVIFREKAKT